MPRTLFSLTIAGLLAYCASGCTAPPTADIAITGVNVVQIEDGAILDDQMILIVDGRISDVRDTGAVNAQEVIDAGGRYAIPGLFDTHVHSIGSNADRMLIDQGLFVAFGVTHVREMGASLESFITSRELFAANSERAQPMRIAAGPLLDNTSFQWYNQTVVADAEEAREILPQLVGAGVDFFKAYSGLQPEAYQGILDEAQRLGLPVDGHVPNAVGLTGVAAGSQRTIEHLNYDTFMTCASRGAEWGPIVGGSRFSDRGWEAYYETATGFWSDVDWAGCVDPALQAFAARGGAFGPTLLMEVMTRSRIDIADTQLMASNDWCRQNLVTVDAADAQIRAEFETVLRDAFNRVRASGVTVLAGTDSQNFCLTPGVSLAWEIETMAEFGLSNIEALQAATLTPAQVFGLEADLGQVAAGFEAHIVLLDEDPLTALQTLRRPSGVFTQGHYFDAAALEALRVAGRTGAVSVE